MIDEPRLIRALDAVVAHLARLGAPVVPSMQPGLSPAALANAESALPFALTEELRALYRWRNGTRLEGGDVLSDLWFFPGFYLPSLEEAVLNFHERKLAPQWRKNWFPFVADGAGDFYVAPCSKQVSDAVPVIGFIHGEPDQAIEYLSLTTMMETFAACYASGAFFLNNEGTLDMDDDAHRILARQHNPGVTEWQD